MVAFRSGEWVPMFPKRLPLCGSAQEALERTGILLGSDDEFRRRWDGWVFAPVALHNAIKNEVRV